MVETRVAQAKQDETPVSAPAATEVQIEPFGVLPNKDTWYRGPDGDYVLVHYARPGNHGHYTVYVFAYYLDKNDIATYCYKLGGEWVNWTSAVGTRGRTITVGVID